MIGGRDIVTMECCKLLDVKLRMWSTSKTPHSQLDPKVCFRLLRTSGSSRSLASGESSSCQRYGVCSRTDGTKLQDLVNGLNTGVSVVRILGFHVTS